jgi:hypothetical protein
VREAPEKIHPTIRRLINEEHTESALAPDTCAGFNGAGFLRFHFPTSWTEHQFVYHHDHDDDIIFDHEGAANESLPSQMSDELSQMPDECSHACSQTCLPVEI